MKLLDILLGSAMQEVTTRATAGWTGESFRLSKPEQKNQVHEHWTAGSPITLISGEATIRHGSTRPMRTGWEHLENTEKTIGANRKWAKWASINKSGLALYWWDHVIFWLYFCYFEFAPLMNFPTRFGHCCGHSPHSGGQMGGVDSRPSQYLLSYWVNWQIQYWQIQYWQIQYLSIQPI